MKFTNIIPIIALLFLASCSPQPIPKAPLNDLARDNDQTLYHIDYINGQLINDATPQPVNVSGEFLEIQGWAVDTKTQSAPETIYFQIGEKQFENTLITKRQDVANVLKMPKAVNVGYSFKVPTKDIGTGVLETKLIIVKKGNKGYYAPDPAKTIAIDIKETTAK